MAMSQYLYRWFVLSFCYNLESAPAKDTELAAIIKKMYSSYVHGANLPVTPQMATAASLDDPLACALVCLQYLEAKAWINKDGCDKVIKRDNGKFQEAEPTVGDHGH